MGCKLCQYVSDVTSTVPVNGKFTEKQKGIYEIVLNANREVIKNIKPGVSWTDMHLLAEKVIITGLKDLGLLNGEVDEMVKARVCYYFMPHGLGHLMGLDVDTLLKSALISKPADDGVSYLGNAFVLLFITLTIISAIKLIVF